ncbi:L-dopachrome tautomerase yellow-f2 [Pseudolycoriella hygida]|uniref:L-dopachrome tautomerase yellow-f2 n=1 Tax=Pseudolycoriella hygida TaxID=35572 RepID=A0A9Q0MIT6_9DIPT|nr:L-dopachrome tautomerase yellow-f2 [Pseudolycoriella hygida]
MGVGRSLIIFQILIYFVVVSDCKLNEFYRWKQMSFEKLETDIDDKESITFPSDLDLIGTTDSNEPTVTPNAEFIAYNNVPMSVAHYKGKVIITVPRRAPGIPSTLNYVNADLPEGSSPSLRPYPNFEMNELQPLQLADHTRIVSVYRTRVDDCGRLWFVCTGALEYNETIQIQRPSLWIIDMNTEKVVQRYEIPESIIEPGRGIISLNVDVDMKSCDNAYAYISDFLTQSLLVYSLKENHMWKFNHKYLQYDLELTKYSLDGFKYQWFDGVFSVALGNRQKDGYRTAYFHPMASTSEFAVNTKVLQNEKLSKRSDHGDDFKKIGERGNLSQSALHDFHQRSGIIFFSQIARNAVSCWNSQKPCTPENNVIVDQNDVTMNYPVDLNIDKEDNLWVLTNTLPRFIYGKLDKNEYNFRIWRTNVYEAIRGTECDQKQGHGYGLGNIGNIWNGHENRYGEESSDSSSSRSFRQYTNSIENFIPYNNVPMGVTHFKGKFIVTIPRRKPGIKSTLNYVSSKFSKGSSPNLRSFPDLETNQLHSELKPDTNKIVSVYRTRMDDCDRMWFVDTGSLQYNGTIQVQRASIWIMNMTTEQVIRRFEIPEHIVKSGQGLISLKKLGERGENSQSAMHDFDLDTGVIIFSQIGKNGLSCWNTATPLTPDNTALIIQNNESMLYPADVNIDNDGNLWVLTNKLPRFVYGKLKNTEYNFRIWNAKVRDVIKGTVCDTDRNQ